MSTTLIEPEKGGERWCVSVNKGNHGMTLERHSRASGERRRHTIPFGTPRDARRIILALVDGLEELEAHAAT